MNTEINGIILMFVLTILFAYPLGKYIANIFEGQRTILDPVFNPIEKFLFRISRLDSQKEMNWKEHMVALLTLNAVWFLLGMIILMNQGWLPLNPDGNPSMTPDLAFNTTVSFVSNTNLQHYSGETGMSYFGQLMLQLFQFISAGAGIAAAAVVFNALKARSTEQLGNFYNYFLKSCTRILLPLSVIVAITIMFNGTPMTFLGKDQVISMQGDTMHVSRGPAAAMVAIKQIGTNGGGFFGANSSVPFENPNYLTNIIENVSINLVPIALVFALGFYLRKKKLAWMIYGVMTVGYLCLLIPTIYLEMNGNPMLANLGVTQNLGSMEGKEVRFGPAASAFWAITTTVTSNGSVNAMHDSLTPLSGMFTMLGMQINALYGGVGVGFLNFFIFIIIAVFIAGLMVGRTPELLGKKVEAKEIKIAMLIFLLHPFLILIFTALASYLIYLNPDLPWLNNPGHHGFSEMLYEYTSSSANNGSGFEGLADNTPWWNISCGVVMLLSRFIPIIGPVAIAGILAKKKYIPESAGTLRTDTGTFGIMVFAVIIILAALSFFIALALGPIAEYFSMS
ncbi:MAG: potassium-transporting ATPase subunit KdpA [Chitinophagales bacterium]|nr:potassium-transporting ATPase subunit KdpA [Chitinophagaceae bacterium]MBP9882654.1 potassium-transporting ATPase subunit KdpA [Chitinophagales bacterium]